VSEAKEFQGKNLDEAIEAACKHFDLKRDKLEIEIVSGGSSGIFGLVGVKKAVVRAKPRGSFNLAEPERPVRPERPERAERPERSERAPERAPEPAQRAAEPQVETRPEPREARPERQQRPEREDRSEASRRSRRGRGRGRSERDGNRIDSAGVEVNGNRIDSAGVEVNGNRFDQPGVDVDGNRGARSSRDGRDGREREGGEGGSRRRRERPRRDIERAPSDERPRREPQPRQNGEDEDNAAPQGIAHLDQEKLVEIAREVTHNLLLPLVENAQIEVALQPDRVLVRIEDPENSGLLIGREGQTLASIQYLVNRLVSKRMDASVRVQIDAGDYRENQDERLRQIARHLADKAMSTGRTQSTRPMSSYHRRVVHLTLQDDEFVFTRSKGEGAMKRVLIMPKRKGQDAEGATAEGAAEVPVEAPEAPVVAAVEPAPPAAEERKEPAGE
jgi:spoIIIJ-associated protein